MLATSPLTQVGSSMMTIGGMFAFLGFSIFDSGLLALGNIFLVFGFFTFLGMLRSKSILLERKNLKFTAFLAAGIIIVLTGRPRAGILVQSFGLYYLLKSFLYMPIQFVRTWLRI
ncbi:hypothetical protein AAMO2058_000966800 [Amorphochlora amoebiformis]